jgi:hypothetical protein
MFTRVKTSGFTRNDFTETRQDRSREGSMSTTGDDSYPSISVSLANFLSTDRYTFINYFTINSVWLSNSFSLLG